MTHWPHSPPYELSSNSHNVGGVGDPSKVKSEVRGARGASGVVVETEVGVSWCRGCCRNTGLAEGAEQSRGSW